MIIHAPFNFLPTLAFLTMIGFLLKRLLPPKTKSKARPPLPPGPSGFPIVGCGSQMLKNRPAFRWIHKVMQEMNTEIACLRIGNVHVIPVTSPELAREFLKKQDLVFCSRPECMSGRLTSSGYLSTTTSPLGKQWTKMRRILVSHVLSPEKHRWLHEKRRGEADNLVRFVYNQCTSTPSANGVVDVRVATRHYCGNVARKLIFNKRFFGCGTNNGSPGPEEEEHVEGLFAILDRLYGFGIADFVPWLEVFDIDGCKKILEDSIKSVRKYHDREIDERIRLWAKGYRVEEEDILDVLINLKDEDGCPMLNVEEIKAQTTEIALAAIDNPSNASEWAIAEMINQPDILKKAQTELDRVVGTSRLVEESDIPNLNYVKACAKEAFRLHPIAPFNLPHVSTKDAVVGGYFIPKGSYIVLSRPGLGRNSRVWKEPLKYDPDRHVIEGNSSSNISLTDNELNMLSFSAGRRGCIAVGLGSTMTVMLLARLVHSFDWSAPEEGGKIDLTENEGNMFKAEPLKARALPRLEDHVYRVLEDEE